MSKIALTGASGYLGCWVLERLYKNNHQVGLLDGYGRDLNAPDPDRDYDILRNADAVIHLSWYSSPNSDKAVHQHCFNQTVKLARDTYRLNPKAKFVFASSAAVYGPHHRGPIQESSWLLPTTSYGTMKMQAERVLSVIFHGRLLNLRIGSLMGLGISRTKTDIVVNNIAVDAYRRGEVKIWHGNDYKSVIHVEDTADIFVQGVETDKIGNVNVCSCVLTASQIGALAVRLTGCKFTEAEMETSSYSYSLDNSRLLEWLPRMKYKTVHSAIAQFEDFIESPSDKNSLWNVTNYDQIGAA